MFAVLIGNQVGNAVELSPKGYNPGVRVDHGMMGEMHVRNDGAAHDRAFAGKLFQPFERPRSAHKSPGHGRGLATFYVRLPEPKEATGA